MISEVSPSSIPSRGHRSVWKTTSDRSGSPNLSDEHLRESAESVSNANQEGKLENYTLETINVETEGNGNAGNAAMDTNEEDEMTESVEVHFEESAWSIPMVLGLVDAGRFDTAYAVLLLFVNCGMQVMFSGAVFDQKNGQRQRQIATQHQESHFLIENMHLRGMTHSPQSLTDRCSCDQAFCCPMVLWGRIFQKRRIMPKFGAPVLPMTTNIWTWRKPVW